MSQLITRQRPFPSFADVRADLRLAELNMGMFPPLLQPSSQSLLPPGRRHLHLPHLSLGCCWTGLQQQPWQTPWQARLWWISWWRANCCHSSYTIVVVAPQPMDWLHPHVARGHRRWVLWPPATCRLASTVGSDGRGAPCLLCSSTRLQDLLPTGASCLGALVP